MSAITPPSVAQQASLRKLSLDIEARDLAHRVAGALQNLCDPPPDALTIFETPAERAVSMTWRIEAYYQAEPDVAQLHAHIQDLLETELPEFTSSPVPDLNWVALSQSALPPVFAGRFAVHGSHDRYRIAQGPNAIRIDAGEAFGTAHHATTYGCLKALDRLTLRRSFTNVLDLGTGSGVLAIAIARALPRAKIHATDLDSRSVEVARENIRANRVHNRIRALAATGLCCPELRRAAPFDLVVANILAAPLTALAPQISRSLKTGGIVLLSGLLDHQAPSVIAHYLAQGLALQCHNRIAGWSTLVLTKRAIAGRRVHA